MFLIAYNLIRDQEDLLPIDQEINNPINQEVFKHNYLENIFLNMVQKNLQFHVSINNSFLLYEGGNNTKILMVDDRMEHNECRVVLQGLTYSGDIKMVMDNPTSTLFILNDLREPKGFKTYMSDNKLRSNFGDHSTVINPLLQSITNVGGFFHVIFPPSEELTTPLPEDIIAIKIHKNTKDIEFFILLTINNITYICKLLSLEHAGYGGAMLYNGLFPLETLKNHPELINICTMFDDEHSKFLVVLDEDIPTLQMIIKDKTYLWNDLIMSMPTYAKPLVTEEDLFICPIKELNINDKMLSYNLQFSDTARYMYSIYMTTLLYNLDYVDHPMYASLFHYYFDRFCHSGHVGFAQQYMLQIKQQIKNKHKKTYEELTQYSAVGNAPLDMIDDNE